MESGSYRIHIVVLNLHFIDTNQWNNYLYAFELVQYHMICHQSVTSWWGRVKSPTSRLFNQTFVQAQITENIKSSRHLPLWSEFAGDRWTPLTKVPSNAENVPVDDVIMQGNLSFKTLGGSNNSFYESQWHYQTHSNIQNSILSNS